MNKEYLLSIANSGPQQFENSTIEIWIKPSEAFDGRRLIGGVLKAINGFTTDMKFGGCFAEDVTDEDCQTLENLLHETLAQMAKAEEISRREPLVLETIDDDTVRRAEPSAKHKPRQKYGYEQYRDEHFTLYVINSGENSHPISCPVILDGKLYRSVYSFWLGRPVYMFKHPEGFQESEGGRE